MTNHALDVLNVHKVLLIIWTHGGYHDDHDSHGYVHNWQGVLEGMEEVTAKSSAAGTPWSIGEGEGGGNIWKRGCQGKNIRKGLASHCKAKTTFTFYFSIINA